MTRTLPIQIEQHVDRAVEHSFLEGTVLHTLDTACRIASLHDLDEDMVDSIARALIQKGIRRGVDMEFQRRPDVSAAGF